MDILLATFNPNKVKEIQAIAKTIDLSLEFLYLKNFPDIKEVIEDGASLEENALKKAKGYYKQSGILTLAEDSGLIVDSLGGAPGVYSSRFAGEEKSDYKNNLKLLERLKGKDNRQAKFICIAALVLSADTIKTFKGELSGHIGYGMQGQEGFGYDPVFIPEGFERSLASLGLEVKNKISHRRKAIRKALEYLKNTDEPR